MLKSIKMTEKLEIRQEIERRLRINEKIFSNSILLFLKKYESSPDEIIKKFVLDLKKGWFRDGFNSWYEGFLPGLPSTSNNIESFNINNLKRKGKIVNRLIPTIHF